MSIVHSIVLNDRSRVDSVASAVDQTTIQDRTVREQNHITDGTCICLVSGSAIGRFGLEEIRVETGTRINSDCMPVEKHFSNRHIVQKLRVIRVTVHWFSSAQSGNVYIIRFN